MDVYIAFTLREHEKLDAWKRTLPPIEQGTTRSYNVSFIATGVREEPYQLFRAIMKSSDGHKHVVTRKAKFHQ